MENVTELEKISKILNDRNSGCDSCCVVSINGTACHERGCRNSWIDPVTGEGYEKECEWCGSSFVPESKNQGFCEDSCAESYWG